MGIKYEFFKKIFSSSSNSKTSSTLKEKNKYKNGEDELFKPINYENDKNFESQEKIIIVNIHLMVIIYHQLLKNYKNLFYMRQKHVFI